MLRHNDIHIFTFRYPRKHYNYLLISLKPFEQHLTVTLAHWTHDLHDLATRLVSVITLYKL